MKFKELDPTYARECFSYDSETGELRWKVRPRIHFNTEHGWKSSNARHAGCVTGYRHVCTVGKAYLQVRIAGKCYYAHRIIWTMVHGVIPEGMQIDHIDGDGTNNRMSNLRLVTDTANKRNQRKIKSNTSGYTGVYADKNRWEAATWQNGKKVSLGRYKTKEEAYGRRLQFNRENGYHANHGTERPL